MGKVLFGCFQLFDIKKQDYLLAEEIDEVMRAMGFRPTPEELTELIEEIDEDGSGAIEFPEFAQLCAKFLVEDPDPETMRLNSNKHSDSLTRRRRDSSPWTRSAAFWLKLTPS